MPKDLPILIKKKGQQNNHKYFRCKRLRIERILKYACENNPQYIANGIKIDYSNLNSLPEDGIPVGLHETEDELTPQIDQIILDVGPVVIDENTEDNEEDYETFIETDQMNLFKKKI